MQSSPLKIIRHFGETCRLHLQGRRNPSKKPIEAGRELNWFLAWPILRPWSWRRYLPPKRLVVSKIHSVRTLKNIFFVITSVMIWNSNDALFLLLEPCPSPLRTLPSILPHSRTALVVIPDSRTSKYFDHQKLCYLCLRVLLQYFLTTYNIS
jgi:hypothetical protein